MQRKRLSQSSISILAALYGLNGRRVSTNELWKCGAQLPAYSTISAYLPRLVADGWVSRELGRYWLKPEQMVAVREAING